MGYVGIEKDYPVSIKEVLDITAETCALETQARVRELKPYKTTDDCISRKEAVDGVKELFELGDCYCDKYSIVGFLNSLDQKYPSDSIVITHDRVKAMLNPKKGVIYDDA